MVQIEKPAVRLKQPTIWLNPGIFIIYGAALDAQTHKHHAIQFVWPNVNSQCQFNEQEMSGPFMINSQVSHQLKLEGGWVLLVEPNSDLGQQLSQQLAKQDSVSLSCHTPQKKTPPEPQDDPTSWLSPLFTELGLSFEYGAENSSVSDPRIQQLITRLNECLPGECLKPASWRASEVAEGLSLSESRFLHLFSEQMGIAWRPYLLWHRMICAVNALMKGSSVTDAAHMAGFSDSAHLSRTFRSHFGMSIRQSQAIFSSQ
jgi:AraC-like DNA-binding protein